MPKPRTGSVRWEKDHYVVRVTVARGKKSAPVHLPKGTSEAMAREKARAYSEAARNGDVRVIARGSVRETVFAWFKRWFDERGAAGISQNEKDRGRFNKWTKSIAKMAMVDVKKEDLERLVSELDEAYLRYDAALKRGDRPKLGNSTSWKNAVNVWALTKKGFADAVNSKTHALRCLKIDPAKDVRGPERGAKRIRSFISPNRFLAFMQREDVPLEWRRTVALAIYTYTRAAELRGMTWADVNTTEGFMVVHQTLDQEGENDSTKVGEGRLVPIEPMLVPLLQAMRGEPDEQAFPLPDDRHMARGLRRWLERANLDSNDLRSSRTKAALTWHDLRGTGVTWRAIRGDDPLHIMAAAGHAEFKTTQKYIRAAAVLAQGFKNVFPPLPECLLVRPSDEPSEDCGGSQCAETIQENGVGEVGFESSARQPSGQKGRGMGQGRTSKAGGKSPIAGPSVPVVSNAEAEIRAMEDELARLVHEAWAVAEGRTKVAKPRRPGTVRAKLKRGAEILQRLKAAS